MLNLNDDQRQNLTTYAMMGGAMVFTIITGILVWIIRYSWPKELLPVLGAKILDHLAWVAFGTLGLVGILVIAMATIAIGGRISAKLGAAEFKSEGETAVKYPTTVVQQATTVTEEMP